MFFLLISSQIIDSIVVFGNKWTSTDYILKYAGVKVGDTLTDSLLYAVKRRLWQLGLFRGVSVEDSNGVLKIGVKETWYIYPFPYVSVSTTEFSLGLGVQHSNFRGRGEHLFFLAAAGSRKILTAGWGTPTHRMVEDVLSVEGGKESYRSFIYRMPIDRYFLKVKFRGRLKGGWHIRMGFLGSEVTSDSTHLLYGGDPDRFLSLEAHIYRDVRDWESYPRRGYLWRVGLVSYTGDFAAWVYGTDWEGYRTFGRLTVVPFLSVWRVFGDLPVYLRLPFVGTSEVVRGSYPPNRLVGAERDVASLEVRYLLFEDLPFVSHLVEGGLAAVLFLDAGRLDTLRAAVGGTGGMLYTPFGSFTFLVGYGTGGLNLFAGSSQRIF